MLKNPSIIKSNYIQTNCAFMNQMRLLIKSIDGEVFSFLMKNHDLIRNIKMKIYDKIGLNIEEQILCYQGAILNDMRELNYYEITYDSLIDVLVRLRGGMQIFIKLMGGSRIDIEIDNRDKIRNLKRKIQEETEIPVNKQQLVYQGSILENNKTIGEYQINDKSEISVTVKLGNDEIKIFAKTSDGKTVEIEVEKSGKIFDLRCEIEEKLRLIANEQKLVYKGVILDDDDKSINEYEICDQSVIDILAKMLIHITTSGGRNATIEICERDKIKDLKYQIEEKLALNMDKQILVFEERILDDDNKSIDEYQICNQSMILLRYTEIEILVTMHNKEIIHLKSLISDKIRDIKKKIEHQTGLAVNRQLLNYEDKILNDDDKTIDQYQINDKSMIYLRRKKMQILVKDSLKRTITINADESDRIEDLKTKIHLKTGKKTEEQRLVFNGLEMENKKTVGKYQLTNRSSIYLLTTLKGGKMFPFLEKQIYQQFYLILKNSNLLKI